MSFREAGAAVEVVITKGPVRMWAVVDQGGAVSPKRGTGHLYYRRADAEAYVADDRRRAERYNDHWLPLRVVEVELVYKEVDGS